MAIIRNKIIAEAFYRYQPQHEKPQHGYLVEGGPSLQGNDMVCDMPHNQGIASVTPAPRMAKNISAKNNGR